MLKRANTTQFIIIVEVIMSRILIVDDEEAIRLLYTEELTDEGYEICTTNNYSALMDIIKQQEPDLIVFDVRSGRASDLDLLQDLRDVYHNMSVILCSAYPGFPYDMKSWIADFYIAKSSDLSELKFQIKVAIEKKIHLRQERLYSENCSPYQIVKKDLLSFEQFNIRRLRS